MTPPKTALEGIRVLDLSRLPGRPKGRTSAGSPAVGEHTEEILHELLHYTPAQVSQLRKEEVI